MEHLEVQMIIFQGKSLCTWSGDTAWDGDKKEHVPTFDTEVVVDIVHFFRHGTHKVVIVAREGGTKTTISVERAALAILGDLGLL